MNLYKDPATDELLNLYEFIPWQELRNSTFFISGATGLIGSSLIRMLLKANHEMHLNIRILALVRDKAKASNSLPLDSSLSLLEGDVRQALHTDHPVDFFVHAASNTSSESFIKSPVETIETSLAGTKNMLELARVNQARSFVYLSSMEVYGFPRRGHKVLENEIGSFAPDNVRNSYPLSKILCESMCLSYFHEYETPVKIVRLTQTFGPGVRADDKRVFAEFARCALTGSDIVLKSKGETERSYLYTDDAVSSILTTLLKGASGEIYNAANDNTYCSIAEMAQLVAEKYGNTVRFELQDTASLGYADTLYMNLSTDKLRMLGWAPKVELGDMYDRLIASISA